MKISGRMLEAKAGAASGIDFDNASESKRIGIVGTPDGGGGRGRCW
jgi:hypothetical protein